MAYSYINDRESVRRFRLPSCAALAFALLPALAPAASLDVYISPPGDQATGVTAASTETFNSLPLGLETSSLKTSIGTFGFSPTAPMAIVAPDVFGGAYNTDYLSLGAESGTATPVSLQLNTPATYFGFWWSAGDSNNGITFYYNNTRVGRISTLDLVKLLNSDNGLVTAINGAQYVKGAYYGNPNNGGDSTEPFAYVNIFAKGTAFNRIVFDNSGSTGTGLEMDNQSVYLGAAQPKTGSVFVESAPAIHVALTPEPPELALAGAVLLGVTVLLRRKRS